MAAAPSPVATAEELKDLSRAGGRWRAQNLETGAIEIVRFQPGPRRLAVHGFSAIGDVWSEGSPKPRLRGARLHFCRAKPCGHKFDPRIEPFEWHGVVIEPLLVGDGVGRGASASSAIVAVAPAGPAEAAEVLAPAAPADAEESAGALVGPAYLGESTLAGAGASSPALVVPAALAPQPLVEASVRRIRLGSAERGQALRALFLQEVQLWRADKFWLPSFALIACAVLHRHRFHLVVRSERIDLIAVACPSLESFLPADADAWAVAAVVVRGDPETRSRSLHWPESEADVMRTNHWVILADLPADFQLPAHAPCNGALCGGVGQPCCGPLLGTLGQLHLVPMPTACDGNCGVDACCEFLGKPRGPEAWCSMRDELVHSCLALADDDSWLSAFDALFVPSDRDLEKALGPAGVPKVAPAQEREAAAREVSEEAVAKGDAPAGSGAAVAKGHAPAGEAADLTCALQWALGSSGADEMSPLAAEVIATLSPDAQAAWVHEWRKSGGSENPRAGSGRGGGKRKGRGKPPSATPAKPKQPVRRRNRSFHVGNTISVLKRFSRFHSSSSGVVERGAFKRFLDDEGVAKDASTRNHFKRVYRTMRGMGVARAQAAAQARAGARMSRQRMLCKQGQQHVKARGLKEALFAWFCSVRGSIAGRLPLDVLYAKAEELRLDFIKEALAKGIKPDVPKFLRTGWMSKFMKKYRISLRRPNKRWKVGRKTLLLRLRTMWSNSIRLRTLCWLAHGYDPRASGFDQKPFHINESGSKEARTLSFKGQKEVALKELHGDTRARWTACTMVVSDEARARARPHLECLFKGGSGVLQKLEGAVAAMVPADAPAGLSPADAPAGLSVQVSDSGSYRLEHVLTYLDRALARRAGEDTNWRLLYCDVYAAHLGDPVSRLAWKHRCVIILHGGGTTGVAQVNDTHLHQALSREYQRLEQQDMFRQLAREPSTCPTRQRGLCMRDLWLIWQREDIHLAAAQGFLRNMLSNALDGSQDWRASGEIARFWDELQMNRIRTEIIADVCEEWEAGRLEWSYEVVYGLVEEHARCGVLDEYVEGQEDEGEDAGDAEPWDDGEESDPPAGGSSAVVEAALTDAQEEELALHDRRLAILDSTMDLAEGEFPSLCRHARDLRDEVVKQSTIDSDADARVARAVRAKERLRLEAAMQDRMRAEDWAEKKRIHEEAVEATIARMEQKGQELAMRERKQETVAARQRVKDAAAARRKAIEEATVSFNAADLGQGQKEPGSERYKKARMAMLDKVFRLGADLPPDVLANWRRWASRFDWHGCHQYRAAWGSRFQRMMKDLLEELQSGKLDACIEWHARMTRAWYLDADDVRVPGRLA